MVYFYRFSFVNGFIVSRLMTIQNLQRSRRTSMPTNAQLSAIIDNFSFSVVFVLTTIANFIVSILMHRQAELISDDLSINNNSAFTSITKKICYENEFYVPLMMPFVKKQKTTKCSIFCMTP